MKNIPILGFTLFVAIYSYFKYTAMPELMGNSQYIFSTAVLVVLTGVLPFILSGLIATRVAEAKKVAVLCLTPLVISLIGMATYFYVFISPNAPGMIVAQVLPRVVIPSLVMSAILLMPVYFQRSKN